MVCFKHGRLLVFYGEELQKAREGGCGWEAECVQKTHIHTLNCVWDFFYEKLQLCPKEMKGGVIFFLVIEESTIS